MTMQGNQMKALVHTMPEKLEIKEVSIPEISADEILIKVKYAGVCGTDVRIYKGTKKIPYPKIIGHEFAGEIARIGQNISEYQLGDRVTVYPIIFCGNCYACKEGRRNICVNRETIGYELDGGFAEYVKIPSKAIKDNHVIKLDSRISYQEASISEPIAAAYHGIERTNLKEGEDLVIVGAGPIGLAHTMLSALRKPRHIIVLEPDEIKREIARRIGATLALNPLKENYRKEILEVTNGKGADVVIIDVGDPSVIEASLTLLRKGGLYLLFAGCPVKSRINIDPNIIHYGEIVLTGSSASTPQIQRYVLDLILKKKIRVDLLISHTFPLEGWKQAFDIKSSYLGIKSILQIE